MNRPPKSYLYLTILFFIQLTACTADSNLPSGIVKIKDSTFHVEIAATMYSRQEGLMNRDSLAVDHGMLFVFPDDRVLSFWMKNTKIPLSIAYIDKEGIIQTIKDMQPYSTQSVSSEVEVRYALEVVQGSFQERNINVGDRVAIPDLSDVVIY
jgi:uncharacterized membrane protein (UPF0127 family)